MSPETAPSPDRPRRGGLFTRIFLTFLTTAIASAVVAAVAGFSFAARLSSEWIEQATETIDQRIPELQAALGDAPTLEQSTRALGQELDAQVGVFDRKGQRLAGEGPLACPEARSGTDDSPCARASRWCSGAGASSPPGSPMPC